MSSKIETVQTPRRLLDVLRFWLERANERSESGDIVELVELRALLANHPTCAESQVEPVAQQQGELVANSIAQMVTEWVEMGIKLNTDWRNGLAGIIQKRLARFPAKPVAHHQGEPVYQVRTHGSSCWEDIIGESLEFCRAQADEYEIRTLYRHPAEQPRPAQLVYPDISTWPEWASWIGLDATGYWVFYENKPETNEVGRIPQGGQWGRPRFAEPQRGWAEMLYERPAQRVRG